MAAIFLQTTVKDLSMRTKCFFLKLAWAAPALVLIFTACPNLTGNEDDAFEGTWVSDDNFIRFEASNGSFTQYLVSGNKEVVRGTYTVSGNTVTANMTEINTVMFGGADAWFTWAALPDQYKEYVGDETQQITITDNTFTAGDKTFTKQNGTNNLP
jgi:hypothetical protein